MFFIDSHHAISQPFPNQDETYCFNKSFPTPVKSWVAFAEQFLTLTPLFSGIVPRTASITPPIVCGWRITLKITKKKLFRFHFCSGIGAAGHFLGPSVRTYGACNHCDPEELCIGVYIFSTWILSSLFLSLFFFKLDQPPCFLQRMVLSELTVYATS